jgi:hypothetical protein
LARLPGEVPNYYFIFNDFRVALLLSYLFLYISYKKVKLFGLVALDVMTPGVAVV